MGNATTPRLHALTFDPAFNGFVLFLLCIAVGVMVFYLYREQQKIASRRIVHWLTAIRIALVMLLMLLLLRPLRQWTSTSNTGGALWVLIDQSLSMKQTDPQASKIEQLRSAEALGYLPAEVRPSKLDRLTAQLIALRAELQYLQTSSDASQQGVQMKRWADQLAELAANIEKDRRGHADDVAAIVADLRSSTPPDLSALARDIVKLQGAADQADTDFLNQSGGDPRVQQAMAKAGVLQRSDVAYAALTQSSQHVPRSLADVLESQETRIVTFAGSQQMLDGSDKSALPEILKNASQPVGGSTDIADALKFVGDQMANSDDASILLVSDGRTNDGGDPIEPARRLAAHGARLFTLAVGSRQVVCDAAVESIDAPDWIYKDDTLRASAMLRLDGLTGKPCVVDFLRGTQIVDTKTVTPQSGQAMQIVSFDDKPPQPGMYDYDIHVREMPGEADTQNNRQGFRVSVKNEKLHALIVEDQPRWEYRYLANYLSRDDRVQLQTVLLEPAHVADVEPPAPVQALATNTDSIEAQLLPRTKEQWAGFDLIVLGDVPVESLPDEMQRNLIATVRDRGAALVVIAGPQNMPGSYVGTPLADVLPVYLNGSWTATDLQEDLTAGFHPTIAPEGSKSILSQFGLDDEANSELWAAMEPWYWHSEQTQAKLSANVLWSIGDASAAHQSAVASDALATARQRALLCTMSVGLGRVMYLASDSTWRLRQVNGQNLHERFWGQVIRWAVGNDLPAGGKLVRFGTNKPRYADGEPIQVTARVLKEDFTPLVGEHFKVLARSGDGGIIHDAQMEDSPEAPGYYRAVFPNLPPGQIELTLQGDQINRLMATDTVPANRTLDVQVLADANLEMQNINADHQAMEQLAEAGGGIALDAPYFDVLADHIPNLRHDQTTIQQIGLFTDPKDPWTRKAHWAFLLLFVSLITTEWILRKAGGLV
jgi:hypothetical protein